jgi:hypothetical protein
MGCFGDIKGNIRCFLKSNQLAKKKGHARIIHCIFVRKELYNYLNHHKYYRFRLI